MNSPLPWAALLWGGFFAALLATSLVSLLRSFGWTRFNPAVQLGCLVLRHPGDPKTDTIGLLFILLLGVVMLPVVYWWAFALWQGPGWGKGAALGLVHGAVAVLLLPAVGMISACVRAGRLEPPRRYGLAYGWPTPLVLLASHVVYGATLGAVLAAF